MVTPDTSRACGGRGTDGIPGDLGSLEKMAVKWK